VENIPIFVSSISRLRVFSVFIYPGACPASVKSAKNYLLKQDAKKITGAVSVGYGLILQAAYSAP
jgi:hypothetical protein